MTDISVFVVVMASLFVGVVLGSINGYRNGLIDGRHQGSKREKQALELLVRALLDLEGSSYTRATRVAGDIRRFLDSDERTQWVRSIRLRNRHTVEEDTFQR